MGTEKPKADLLPGTLDMLVLKILMRGHLHGDAIAPRIQQLSVDLLHLNNQPVAIVGVLPASFDFASIFAPGTPVDIFIPWPLNDKTKPRRNAMKVIGRLQPGATVQGAQAELTALGKQLRIQHPERNPAAGAAGTARTWRSCSGAVRACPQRWVS
jgi:hypothetical protein